MVKEGTLAFVSELPSQREGPRLFPFSLAIMNEPLAHAFIFRSDPDKKNHSRLQDGQEQEFEYIEITGPGHSAFQCATSNSLVALPHEAWHITNH